MRWAAQRHPQRRLQCAVQLAECNDGGVSAQTLDHAVHNGVVGHTQLHALQIIDGCNGLDGEEVTEALLAVEQAANGQAQLLGLVQELRCQIAVGEVPEVCAVVEGKGDGQQLRLVAAVAGQSESEIRLMSMEVEPPRIASRTSFSEPRTPEACTSTTTEPPLSSSTFSLK